MFFAVICNISRNFFAGDSTVKNQEDEIIINSQLFPPVNKLNGVGRDGMVVNQSDSDRGSILTLGRNSNGELGFFYYMSTEKIPPYRAYLTYE